MENNGNKERLELIYLFLRFLKDNDAYNKYKEAFYSKKNSYRAKEIDILTFLLRCSSFTNFIGAAFPWDVLGNSDYWYNLYNNWKKMI